MSDILPEIIEPNFVPIGTELSKEKTGFGIDDEPNVNYEEIQNTGDELQNWSEVIDDNGNKPDDDATVGATVGTNLKDENSETLSDDDIRVSKKFTAGEDILTGNVVCLTTPVDQLKSNTQDTFVNEFAPDTNNNGSVSKLRVGNQNLAAVDYEYRILLQHTALTAGQVPYSAKIRLNVSAFSGSTFTVHARFITASWDDDTATWNTIPASEAAEVGKVSITGTGTFDIDITKGYRRIMVEATTIYGIELRSGGATGSTNFATLNDIETSASHNQLVYQDTLGTAKLYKADNTSYMKCRNVIGTAMADIAEDATGKVQMFGIISGLSLNADHIGLPYYLKTGGGLGIAATKGVLDKNNRNIELGIVLSATELLWKPVKQDLYIETLTAATQYPLPWAQKVKVDYFLTDANASDISRGQIEAERYERNNVFFRDGEKDGGSDYHQLEVDWTDNLNKVVFTTTSTIGSSENHAVRYYE